MNTKKIVITLVVLALVVVGILVFGGKKSGSPLVIDGESVVLNDGNYSLDTAQSTFSWRGDKVGGSHVGTVVGDAELQISNGRVQSGAVTIDMSSVTSTDVTDSTQNKKLVEELKGENFFDIANYPTATFTLIDIVQGDDNMPYMHGTMTLHGVSKELFVPITLIPSDNQLVLAGSVELVRADFGMKLPVPLDTVVDNSFTVDFVLTLIANQ